MWGALIAAGAALAGKIVQESMKDDPEEQINPMLMTPSSQDRLRQQLLAGQFAVPQYQRPPSPAASNVPMLAPRNTWG